MSDASCKQPGSTWRPRRSRPLIACAALAALLTCLFPLAGARAAVADASSSARISLNANVPAVSRSGHPVVVSGTITDTGSEPIDNPVVHLSVSSRLLDTRATAVDWMAGRLDVPVTQVATGTTAAVGPGGSAAFSVTIPGSKLKFGYGLASLPLSVTVTDGQSSDASAIRGMTRSTVEQQNASVRSPLQVSIVIPLTLPADPALFGPTGAARAAAWERAVGPDSTVQRTLDAFAGLPVTFAVDPELLDPPAAPDGNVPPVTTPPSSSSSTAGSGSSSDQTASPDSSSAASASPDPSSTSTAASGDSTGSAPSSSSASSASSSPASSPTPTTPAGRQAAAVTGLQQRLSSLSASESVWWLPEDDPDLTALHAAGTAGAALLARDLDRPLPSAARAISSSRVVWPAADAPAATVTAATRTLTTGQDPAFALLPERSVPATATLGASHRVTGTSGVLTYDEGLSRAFSVSSTSPGTQTSRLLTATLAVYQQSPGTARSLALVAPRTGGAGPTQLAAQVRALQTASWVRLRTGAQTRAALGAGAPTALLSVPSKGTAYPSAAPAAISVAELHDVDVARSRLDALQDVMVDGAPVLDPRRQALDVVGSSRWRGASATGRAVSQRDDTAVAALLAKLSIRSSTINFFADSGDISVTIANDLARPVKGVLIHLQPRKYLIQVTDAERSADVDAGSHSTARFHLKAVGAGTVPVDAMLSAPNGAPLGISDAPSQLKINVHPTSGWIMWVLGVLAGLILVVGLWRAVRRGPRTVSGPTPAGKPTPNEAIVDAGPATKQPTDDEDTDTDE